MSLISTPDVVKHDSLSEHYDPDVTDWPSCHRLHSINGINTGPSLGRQTGGPQPFFAATMDSAQKQPHWRESYFSLPSPPLSVFAFRRRRCERKVTRFFSPHRKTMNQSFHDPSTSSVLSPRRSKWKIDNTECTVTEIPFAKDTYPRYVS